VRLIFSGTLLIVRECSDIRCTVAVKWRPARDSLIRRINSLMARFNSLMARFNSLLRRNKFLFRCVGNCVANH
jgi:hypothetical protein